MTGRFDSGALIRSSLCLEHSANYNSARWVIEWFCEARTKVYRNDRRVMQHVIPSEHSDEESRLILRFPVVPSCGLDSVEITRML